MQGSVDYRGRTKYDATTARAYKDRPRRQHAAEMALINRVFKLVPSSHKVLDLPCGAGRVSLHLAEQGYQVTAADYSDSMLEITRAFLQESGHPGEVDKQDIEALSYSNGQFDTIICFRLFHHFPNPKIRRKAVSELCRVSARYVALSYFSPFSVTSVKRRLRVGLGGRASEKYATPLAEVESYFQSQGFALVRDFARIPLLHTLHVALFERTR
ncbi:MAG: class I SAM-dependent methyltransferase [Candidatus Accumulibacter propinquus]|jgi:ubiquinone/menaquinone biosynthesis C-methylase UbiE|uniref:class I SAM-dependent methyltransferase n=1 Tax=Candidatus Accumulibacter propinquus TaxID=2954380 RepID=UPI002FC303C7